MENKKKVLLTGITGFLGSHTAIQLLEKGYHVIGTLRDIKRVASIKDVIAQHTTHIDNLSFAEAEINDAGVWKTLMKDIDFVQHIASPFPKVMPKNEDDIIIPARQGNVNILSAAAAAGVKRVVITGSSSAVSYGQLPENKNRTYDESDWTDLNLSNDLTPYFKSKTIAEKAAWDFMAKDTSGLELTVVCPGLILGPLLEQDFNASANVVIKMLDGSLPAVPKIGYDIVDVRSVASLLILAMEKTEAAGERYIGAAGYMTFSEIAAVLKNTYPKIKIPTRKLPNFMVRIFSLFDPTLNPILLDLGTKRLLNHSKAVNQLGWNPILPETAVITSALSILKLGIVKSK